MLIRCRTSQLFTGLCLISSLCLGQPCWSATDTEKLRQQIEAFHCAESPALAGELLRNPVLIQDFYQRRQFEPMWMQNSALSQQGQNLLAYLTGIDAQGLLPDDYHASSLQRLHSTQTDSDASLAELMLSDAFFTLSQHLLAGKVDPSSLSPEWQANRRRKNLVDLLERVANGESVTQILTASQPRQIRYQRLIDALDKLRRMPTMDWPALPLSPLIRAGGSDSRLAEIAARLQLWGDLAQPPTADIYSPELQTAVRKFQARHGLQADGIIGEATMQALNKSPQQRARQIEVNLERWRWLAEDLGETHILVNIAGYELKVIENNATVLRMPVVVGRTYRKTPVFSDRVRYLVLHPAWAVPYKLATQDKLPEIQKNPDYFTSMGFKVYDRRDGRLVDSATVDWKALDRSHFPYQLVQDPGPLNALGQVKFMFPNQYNVYLHDTPSKDLFARPERAFSSGCIRLGEPLALAEYLLKDAGWDRQRLDGVLQKGATATVFLHKPVPVHIEYWTTWIGSSGDLNFREDIYGRDEPLWKALKTPLNEFQDVANPPSTNVSLAL